METGQSEDHNSALPSEAAESEVKEEITEVVQPSSSIDEDEPEALNETPKDSVECAICLEIVCQRDSISLQDDDDQQSCIHTYHEACIQLVNIRWCPLCRQPFATWKLRYPPPSIPKGSEKVIKSIPAMSPRPPMSRMSNAGRATARSTTTVRLSQQSAGTIDRRRVDAERIRLNARLSYRPSSTPLTWRPARHHNNTESSSSNASSGSLSSSIRDPSTEPSQPQRSPQVIPLLPAPLPPPPPPPPTTTQSDITVFPLQLLRSPTLPSGVDPKRLETYLSDDDFHRTFKMSKDMFGRLSKGQKIVLRRQNGLHR